MSSSAKDILFCVQIPAVRDGRRGRDRHCDFLFFPVRAAAGALVGAAIEVVCALQDSALLAIGMSIVEGVSLLIPPLP